MCPVKPTGAFHRTTLNVFPRLENSAVDATVIVIFKIIMTRPKQMFNLCILQLPHEVAKLNEVCDAMLSRYPTHSYPLEALSEHYIRTGQFIKVK